jgi:hypothetical protein
MLSARIHTVILSGIVLAAAAGCANRPPMEYFEPVGGVAAADSEKSTGPRATAVSYGPNATLTVRAPVNQGLASVQLVLALRQGADVRFTGRRVIIEVAGRREEREMTWDESIVENGRPRTERIPFDAVLRAPTVTGQLPKEGLFPLGLSRAS